MKRVIELQELGLFPWRNRSAWALTATAVLMAWVIVGRSLVV